MPTTAVTIPVNSRSQKVRIPARGMTFVIMCCQFSGSAEKPMTKIATMGMETIAAATSAAMVAVPIRFPAGAPEEMAGWAVPGRGSVDKRSALANAGMAFL